MAVIAGSRKVFVAKMARRGYTLNEVAACITSDDGTTIAVDVDHPAYPREARLGFSPPSLARKAANFAKAAMRHIADRGRQCTPAEVEARFAICEQCPLYVDHHCSHQKCGCKISKNLALVSKLSWASESCPEGKWSAIPLPNEADSRSIPPQPEADPCHQKTIT
jgi:hypothetical protein